MPTQDLRTACQALLDLLVGGRHGRF